MSVGVELNGVNESGRITIYSIGKKFYPNHPKRP